MINKKNFIVSLLLIIFVIGCVPSKPVYKEEVLPADRLVKRLEANRRKIKTFQGSGIINVESKQIDAKASFEVYLKKPDSIKFVIYGPFGIDLAQALITRSEFQFYDVMKNTVFKGRNDHKILNKIFHVDLTFSELIDAFAGAVNLTDKLRLEPDKYKVTDEEYFLTYDDSLENKQSIFKIQIDNLAINKYELYKNNNILLFEGIYSNFQIYDRVAIPSTIVVQNKLNSQKVTIDYRNIEVNENVESLDLDIPKDARIKEW